MEAWLVHHVLAVLGNQLFLVLGNLRGIGNGLTVLNQLVLSQSTFAATPTTYQSLEFSSLDTRVSTNSGSAQRGPCADVGGFNGLSPTELSLPNFGCSLTVFVHTRHDGSNTQLICTLFGRIGFVQLSVAGLNIVAIFSAACFLNGSKLFLALFVGLLQVGVCFLKVFRAS